MFERPSGDLTSTEKMVSQKSASNVRPGKCPSTADKGREGCMPGGPVSQSM